MSTTYTQTTSTTIYTADNSTTKLLSSYQCNPLDEKNKIGEYTSLCVQEKNNNKTNIEKEPTTLEKFYVEYEEEKNKLIEQATNRLKQKLLESKLKDFISSLVEIKSQLEIIKLETSVSLQLLPTTPDNIMSELQLQHFEKRLYNHLNDLQDLFCQNSDKIEKLSIVSSSSSSSASAKLHSSKNEIDYPMDNMSDSMSSSSSNAYFPSTQLKNLAPKNTRQKNIISYISSVFPIYKDNSEGLMESDYSILSDYDHKKRLTKRKKLYQNQNKYQNVHDYNDSNSCILSTKFVKDSTSQSPSPSICSSLLKKDNLLDASSVISDTSINLLNKSGNSAIYKRNALDDVLSYINSNTDDIEFKNDISQMLFDQYSQSNTSCICHPLYQSQQSQTRNYTCKKLLKNIILTTLRWIRFTVVLFLAVLINLKRGPTSFLYMHNNNNSHYQYYPYYY